MSKKKGECKIKNPHITKEMFLEELERQKGSCYAAYNSLGLPYNRYRQWRLEDPEFDKACADLQYAMVEFAEHRMYDLIAEGNPTLLKFFLSARGNYTEKKQIDVNSTNTVDVNSIVNDIKNELTE